MAKLIQNIREFLFIPLPEELRGVFRLDCAHRNNLRFFVLPFFNIFTQLGCYIIYLHIYPSVYPERPALDPGMFTVFSAVYVLANAAFALLFYRQGRARQHKNYVRNSYALLLVFLVSYVLMEGAETIMEIRISGNLYRFLATFFMVAFLPVLPRIQKAVLLVLYATVVETGFSLLVRMGFDDTNRYIEIVFVFLLVCLIVSNGVYSSAIKNFLLRHELVLANRKLQDLIGQDPLTGIHNRRAFNEYVEKTWKDCVRNGHPLHALMIDVDHFKEYNDEFGHLSGDKTLVRIAQFLDGSFSRSSDMVARFGGEEFIVLLPYTNIEGVMQCANNLCDGVRGMNIPGAGGKPLTISVGVATLMPGRDKGVEELLRLADDALYRAKNTGRDRVCMLEMPTD